MGARYQLILRQVRLLIAGLVFAVAVEPPSWRFDPAQQRAQVVALAEAPAARSSVARRTAQRAPGIFAPPPRSLALTRQAADSRSRPDPEPDGRRLYLVNSALLC